MKALVVRQPWATLIALGIKTVETRPWPPNGPMRPDGVRGLPGLAVERGAPASRATVRRRRPSSNVLRRLMEDFDASTPDGLLHALADAGAVEITIRCVPRRGRHGAHAVSWTQAGRRRTEEGSTLDTALRAAVRAAEAHPATQGAHPA